MLVEKKALGELLVWVCDGVCVGVWRCVWGCVTVCVWVCNCVCLCEMISKPWLGHICGNGHIK